MPAEQAKPLMLCSCLQSIEGEMDEQMGRYDELNIVGQALISYLPSFPQTTEKIQLRLEEYKNRWDRLVQQMEQQSWAIPMIVSPAQKSDGLVNLPDLFDLPTIM